MATTWVLDLLCAALMLSLSLPWHVNGRPFADVTHGFCDVGDTYTPLHASEA